jgi:hypothetical protein
MLTAVRSFGKEYLLGGDFFSYFQKSLLILLPPIDISLYESSAKEENPVQKSVLMELDFGMKFILRL